MLIETLDTARDLGRLKEILGVMVRHGFGDTVRRLGLADRLERAGQVLNWPHAAELARLEPPVQVRLALEELGPTFVKFGQILAGRADLFGPEWIAEFEKLHSHVPALPIDALRPQLREDLGDEPEAVFAWFDTTPLAAASIAQVHRARLHDGTEVIVKIRRPGIADTIQSGPSELFGNGGGPFIVSLSDGKGGFQRAVVALHPQAVALDQAGGHPRLWTYWRSSCCAGTLGITVLDGTFETRTIPLDFGPDPQAPTLSRAVYDGVFRDAHRIVFERVDGYQPPPAIGGEWGK